MNFGYRLRMAFRQLAFNPVESILIIVAVALGVLVLNTVLSPLYVYTFKTDRDLVEYEVRIMPYDPNPELINNPNLAIVPYLLVDEETTNGLKLSEVEEIFNAIPQTNYYFFGVVKGYQLPGYPIQRSIGPTNYEQEGMFYFTHLSPEAISGMGLKLAAGSVYSKDDFFNTRPYVILGSNLAKRLFPNENPIGKEIEVAYARLSSFTVLGVFEPVEGEKPDFGSKSIINNINNIAASSYSQIELNQQEPVYNYVTFVPKSANPNYIRQVNSYLESKYKNINKLYRTESLYAMFDDDFKDFRKSYVILGFISAFVLLIACINIINLLFTRIANQSKSIGLNMAIGATKKDIFNQYLVSSVLQGLSGSVIGILLFWLLSKSSLGQKIYITFSIKSVPYGLLIGLLMSFAFGIYPAVLASNVSPVEALRTE